MFEENFHCSKEKKLWLLIICAYRYCNYSIEDFSQIGVEDEDDVDPGTGFNELREFVELIIGGSIMYILLLVQFFKLLNFELF